MRRSAARLARFADALAPTLSSSRTGLDGRLVEPRTREWRREHRHRRLSSHATRPFPASPTDVSRNDAVPSERPPRTPRMRFASGLSKREDLSLAVVEAVAEVKARLGHDAVPTFVQVMVSSAYADPSAAPGYVLECFTRTEPKPAGSRASATGSTSSPPPALFGGTVTGAIGGAGAIVDGFGVSVFAGVMPDVEAVAFRVADASLPSQLTAEQWMRISGGERTDRAEHARGRHRPPRVAALMLACADFDDVETFTGRLHAAAPGAVVAGAVAKPGGALFCGSEDVTREPSTRGGEDKPAAVDDALFSFLDARRAEESEEPLSIPALARARASRGTRGAVGVLLVGDFDVEAHSLHAHRPVGPPMTLTRAGADGVVLELDGRAAGDALASLLASLPDGVAGMPVLLGMRDVDVDVAGADADARRASSNAEADAARDAPPGDSRDGRRDASAPDSAGASVPSPSRRRGRSAWVRGRVVDDVAADTPEGASAAARAAGSGPRDRTADDAAKARHDASPPPPTSSSSAAAEEAHAERAYGDGGAGYVYRDIVGVDRETGGVFVGQHALREGSRVQLHVRDAAWGKARVKALLSRVACSEPARGPVGAVMYTCVSGNRMHAGDFREAVAACPLGGGFVAGEIAPAERGARAALQSHTSVVAVFRERARDAGR